MRNDKFELLAKELLNVKDTLLQVTKGLHDIALDTAKSKELQNDIRTCKAELHALREEINIGSVHPKTIQQPSINNFKQGDRIIVTTKYKRRYGLTGTIVKVTDKQYKVHSDIVLEGVEVFNVSKANVIKLIE